MINSTLKPTDQEIADKIMQTLPDDNNRRKNIVIMLNSKVLSCERRDEKTTVEKVRLVDALVKKSHKHIRNGNGECYRVSITDGNKYLSIPLEADGFLRSIIGQKIKAVLVESSTRTGLAGFEKPNTNDIYCFDNNELIKKHLSKTHNIKSSSCLRAESKPAQSDDIILLNECWDDIIVRAKRRNDPQIPFENQITGAAAEFGFRLYLQRHNLLTVDIAAQTGHHDFQIGNIKIDVKGSANEFPIITNHDITKITDTGGDLLYVFVTVNKEAKLCKVTGALSFLAAKIWFKAKAVDGKLFLNQNMLEQSQEELLGYLKNAYGKYI